MNLLRYGVPAVLIVVGIFALGFAGEAVRYELFGMCVGAGLSLLLFTFLFRVGVSGESERKDEEDARDYYAQHGRWPDDKT